VRIKLILREQCDSTSTWDLFDIYMSIRSVIWFISCSSVHWFNFLFRRRHRFQ
jgi:hypothetical protein